MSQAADPWDEPRRPVASLASTSKLRATVVRDDWELDDEEEEEDTQVSSEEKNKQIWEDANTKEHHPMPALVISRGAFASVTTPSLPLNQPPTMKILKRPSASTPNSSATLTTPAGESLQKREARYQAARERIFGPSNEETSLAPDNKKNLISSKTPSPTSTPAPSAAKVVRNPRGPPNTTAGALSDNGFKGRKKIPPLAATTTASTGASDIPI